MSFFGSRLNFGAFGQSGSGGEFSDWTQTDPTAVISQTDSKISFTNLEKGTNCYVYKDYGADYFSDFEIHYECEMTAGTNRMVLDWLSMGNSTYGTYTDHEDATDGFSVHYWNNLNTTVWFVLRNHTNGTQQYGSWNRASGVLEKVYCKLVQSGNDISNYVYEDAARTTLLTGGSVNNPQVATIAGFTGRYLSTAATIESESGIYATGYIQNLQIVTP
jgi:hypothetical protein